MIRGKNTGLLPLCLCIVLSVVLSSCSGKVQANPSGGEPPAPVVEHEQDPTTIKVEHPNEFPLVKAREYDSAPQLNVTGSVSPDVSRTIPVISLASGRVVEIHTRLGDTVTKGQLLMRIQSADIAQAFADYRQAVADEWLARSQYDRAKLLYSRGAIAEKDLEVAKDADEKAKVTLENTIEKIHVLGADLNHPSSLIDVRAPVSGYVTEQNVANAGGVKTLDNSPNLFTISDLSDVWILCDVYENQLPFVRLGEFADVHLSAYPNVVLKGRIGNIGPILDPNIRTAKVRLELHNPGMLRPGMFVSAIFYGLNKEKHVAVPASAILHLHDRDWVYVPIGGGRFRRIEVSAGRMLPDSMQEVTSGIAAGEDVVLNALVLENAVQQE